MQSAQASLVDETAGDHRLIGDDDDFEPAGLRSGDALGYPRQDLHVRRIDHEVNIADDDAVAIEKQSRTRHSTSVAGTLAFNHPLLTGQASKPSLRT